jgi:hypothetical protein
MSVLREWTCLSHGHFESKEPICPYGCDTAIERAFLTAPGIASTRTRNIDRTLQQLAVDYGMTDLNNKQGHGSVMDGARRAKELEGLWHKMPAGDPKQRVNLAVANTKAAYGDLIANQYAAQRGLAPPPEIKMDNLPKPVPQVDPKLKWGSPADIQEAVKRV